MVTHILLVLLNAGVLGAQAASGCTSDLDCSLNGECVKGTCTCDPPWSGATCESMRFKPVKATQGYGMSPNLTSWGGGAIFDGKKYHLYVSAMTNDCKLSTWTKNSRIDHAIADAVEGPYTFQDVAVNTWSHNSAPIDLLDGTFAIVHIGSGDGKPDGGQNCTPHVSSTEDDAQLRATAGSTIHTSNTLQGPWQPLMNNTLGGCNNPAPWVHPNGTIYIVCGGTLKRSEKIWGPWKTVTGFSHKGGPAGNYEDPVLYTDKRGFHVFYHVYNYNDREDCVKATVSAHVFSEDGYTWHASAVQPYTTQVEVEGGGTITVSTRERPKLFFDRSGQMTHLFNGVCSATKCPSEKPCVDCKYAHWDYTLAQPLDLSQAPPVPFPPAPPPPPPAGCANKIPGYTCHQAKCSGNLLGADKTDCGKTLKEPGFDCKDWACAAAQAKKACEATTGCASFALSDVWGLGHTKLFTSGVEKLVDNGDWNVWVKDNEPAVLSI